MPHFRLVPVNRPELRADEIILKRDDQGEVTHSLSIHELREIPQELHEEAILLASKMGYKLVEGEPEEKSEEGRPVADDAGQGPVVTQRDESTSEIDHRAQSGQAAQQNTAETTGARQAPPTTTAGGFPGSSATTPPATTNP